MRAVMSRRETFQPPWAAYGTPVEDVNDLTSTRHTKPNTIIVNY